MGIKKIYFHIFVTDVDLGQSHLGGFNAIKTWTSYLEQNRYQYFIGSNLDFNMKEFLQSDLVFICNGKAYLPEIQKLCHATGKKYATIPFFEEMNKYWSVAKQFAITMVRAINSNNTEQLLKNYNPQHVKETRIECIDNQQANTDVFNNALFNLTNSKFEADNLKILAPKSRVETIRLSCGILENENYAPNNEFLKCSKLSKGEYILQIGRIDLRKNQLASVISSRNNKAPLVFIFSHMIEPAFSILVQSIKKLRKDKRTVFVTDKKIEDLPECIELIYLNNGISDSLVISALQNAGLYLNPSFYELPGYTYLEAAKLGVATVASSWGSLKDYFTNSDGQYTLDKRISYSRPYDIHTLEKQIESQFSLNYPNIAHPTFRRTRKEMSIEMQALLDKYI